jgi:hypothetical protein
MNAFAMLAVPLTCCALLSSGCQSMPASAASASLAPASVAVPVAKATALAPSNPLVGRWRLESASTDNATIQGLGIKTSGYAQLEADGTGVLDMVAKLGFISRAKKSSFTWRRDGNDLLLQETDKQSPTVWKLIDSSENRMEAEVPSGKQKVRMVFIRAQ